MASYTAELLLLECISVKLHQIFVQLSCRERSCRFFTIVFSLVLRCVSVRVCVCVGLVIGVTKHTKGNVTQPDVFIVNLFIMADETDACGFSLHVIYVLDTVFGFVSVQRY